MKNINVISIMIASFVFAAVMVGAFVWIMISLTNERRMLEASASSQSEAITRDTYGSSLRNLARDTKLARGKLNSVTEERNIVSVIEILESAGNSARLQISIDAVSAGSDDGLFRNIVVALSAEGSFNEVVHLLSLLEALPAAALIEQFEIEKSKTSDNAWQIRVRILVLVESDS